MAEENKNNSFAIIAVVAIVAVVALVILVSNKGMAPTVLFQPSSLTTESGCANSNGVDTITIPEGADAKVEGDTLILTPKPGSNVEELASNLAGLGVQEEVIVPYSGGGTARITCGCPRGCSAQCAIGINDNGAAVCRGSCNGNFCQNCVFSKPQMK